MSGSQVTSATDAVQQQAFPAFSLKSRVLSVVMRKNIIKITVSLRSDQDYSKKPTASRT